jgi:hypothetical protein
MTAAQPGTSCTSLFKQLEILPVPCKSILSLMNFIVSNQEIFQTNSSIDSIKIRNKHDLHRPILLLKKYICAGMKIFSNLPRSLTNLKNEKAKFKVAIRKYFNTYSFYSIYEFL